MAMIFLSHATRDAGFVNLLEAVLAYSGVKTWRSTSGLPPGVEYQREIEAALGDADSLLVVVSANAVGSHWVRHEADRFSELHPAGRVIPVLLDATAPRDVRPALERFQSVDFSACMLTGFVRLLKVFGKEFVYQNKRAGRTDRRLGKPDRRSPANMNRRVRVGFWKAFVSATGYGEFQGLPLGASTKYKAVQALLPEAVKYKFADKRGAACDAEAALRQAIDQTWQEWADKRAPDGGPMGAAYIIEDVAMRVCRTHKVSVIDRRTKSDRRGDKA